MDFKQSLSSWASATDAWDRGETQSSLDALNEVENPSSKILFNMGCAYSALADYHNAIRIFTDVLSKDEHMAIGFYQRGCVHYKMKRYQKSIEDFLTCQNRFRGRSVIDYGQLGLKYKLHLCEAQYNVGVCEGSLGNFTIAEENIATASKCKGELRHKFMKAALSILKNGSIPDVYEIPRDAIYRPPKGKVDNMHTRDYLGKAKVISSVDHGDGFSGFVGPKKLEERQKQNGDCADIEELIKNKMTLDDKTVSKAKSAEAKLSSSAPNSPIIRPRLERQRSRDDSFIDKPPTLPPRTMPIRGASADNLTHIGSTGRKLPPPPTRPPPKLERRPLPPEPKMTSDSYEDLVRVEFHCNTVHIVEVTHGTSLENLTCCACRELDFKQNSITLWSKDNGGPQFPVVTESQMKKIWERAQNGHLRLWCYAK